jgi:uncharacterized protein YbjT (DUF2867 family)
MQSNEGPVLVIGATGNQGGATARRLRAAGCPVRALVRDPAGRAAGELAAIGVELVPGDLDDPAAVQRAARGARGVFAVPPVAFGPGGTDVELETVRGRTVVDAAAAAGVEHVVFSGVGSLSGGRRLSVAKARVEEHLWASGLSATVLRPVRFMENYLGTAVAVDGIADGIHRHLFPPDEPVQIVAVDDIAEFAALAFGDPQRYRGRTIELAGDDPTPTAAAATISAAIGLPVRYEQIGRDEAHAVAPEVATVHDVWAAGHRWHADIEVLRVVHPGLRTLADWLAGGGARLIRAQQLEDAVPT